MKSKWSLIGNNKVIEFLDLAIKNNNLANFYIFSGPSNLGKFLTAKDLALNIFNQERLDFETLINQGDILIIEREAGKKDISINQIRSLISFFQLSSSPVVIIKDAENLNQNSANALLKLLEEPKSQSLIILTVNNLNLIPGTIISRAQVLSFFPVKDDLIYQYLIKEKKVSPVLAKNLSRISGGHPELARYLLDNRSVYQNYQDVAVVFIDFLGLNFSERCKIIEEGLKKELPPSFNLLDIWELVWRDLVLLSFSQSDYIRHPFLLERLEKLIRESFLENKIEEQSQVFSSARSLLETNLNLESVLEYLAINL